MSAPSRRSPSTRALIRSDSFTRSSRAPRTTVSPFRLRGDDREHGQLVVERRDGRLVDGRRTQRRCARVDDADRLVHAVLERLPADVRAHPRQQLEVADPHRVERDVVDVHFAGEHGCAHDERGGRRVARDGEIERRCGRRHDLQAMVAVDVLLRDLDPERPQDALRVVARVPAARSRSTDRSAPSAAKIAAVFTCALATPVSMSAACSAPPVDRERRTSVVGGRARPRRTLGAARRRAPSDDGAATRRRRASLGTHTAQRVRRARASSCPSCRNRAPTTATIHSSMPRLCTDAMSSRRSTRTPYASEHAIVDATSAPGARLRTVVRPDAAAPSMRARCEIDLSPGTETDPDTDAGPRIDERGHRSSIVVVRNPRCEQHVGRACGGLVPVHQDLQHTAGRRVVDPEVLDVDPASTPPPSSPRRATPARSGMPISIVTGSTGARSPFTGKRRRASRAAPTSASKSSHRAVGDGVERSVGERRRELVELAQDGVAVRREDVAPDARVAARGARDVPERSGGGAEQPLVAFARRERHQRRRDRVREMAHEARRAGRARPARAQASGPPVCVTSVLTSRYASELGRFGRRQDPQRAVEQVAARGRDALALPCPPSGGRRRTIVPRRAAARPPSTIVDFVEPTSVTTTPRFATRGDPDDGRKYLADGRGDDDDVRIGRTGLDVRSDLVERTGGERGLGVGRRGVGRRRRSSRRPCATRDRWSRRSARYRR